MKPNMFGVVAVLLYLAVVTSAKGQLVKRSDDTDPVSVVVSTLSQSVTALQAQVQAMQTELQTMKASISKKAAFQAILPSDTLTPNAPIHLNVISQTGNGYDATSGMYVAPYSGWYSVDFQLFPKQVTQGYFNVDLNKNGDMVARARCIDPTVDTTCSTSITLHVNAGDKMWVQTDLANVLVYNTLFDSFVSIVLVSAD